MAQPLILKETMKFAILRPFGKTQGWPLLRTGLRYLWHELSIVIGLLLLGGSLFVILLHALLAPACQAVLRRSVLVKVAMGLRLFALAALLLIGF